MGLLQDCVVIVTGSASGIGYATSSMALSEGAHVFGVDVSPLPADLSNHPKFQSFQGDLTDETTAQAIVAACTQAFGNRIDGLLNVAGVLDNFASVDRVTDQVWNKCLAVNLTAPVKLMPKLELVEERPEWLILLVRQISTLISDAQLTRPMKGKHGLIGVTKNVAWRFKDENIRCNAVCPGGVSTNIGRDIDRDSFDMEAFETMKPIQLAHMPDQSKGPSITPEEVARVLVFLVSGLSSRVNGAVIPVDDAWSTI
ncbi:uncharacterized protein BHQ10_003784 [Talaromyces amestolkiae]|uniref:Uncharacterized protein n=1 Tax=Talaromyces amestolkiae TaxID=1196081 RepID=A0A364KW28_TALAM|nr:uncharacterized protein BHQ10_003784 [Talaromyces amestolkiae]RAO67772.1 hypothetical protein BHQ10_003784 [Talaromyces amestolkiae]